MCRSDSSSLSAASPLQGAPGPQASDIVEKPGKEHLLFPQNSPHLLLSVKDDKVLLDSFKAFLEIVIFLLKNRKEPHVHEESRLHICFLQHCTAPTNAQHTAATR